MIIDAHTHYHASGVLASVFGHLYGHTYGDFKTAKGDDDAHFRIMEERGYDMQIISQPPFTQAHDQTPHIGIGQAKAFNDSMAKGVAESNGRFRFVGSMPLQDLPASPVRSDGLARLAGPPDDPACPRTRGRHTTPRAAC